MIRTIAAATACACLAAPAHAALFTLQMEGVLRAGDTLTRDGDPADLLTATTPFRFEADFESLSPNLVGFFPFPGFAAYAPLRATLQIAGTTYAVPAFSAANPNGIAVSIFDRRQPFFPGFYGIGFIANPAVDGAGIVADFGSASPDFVTDALSSTTFGAYGGAGYNAGPGCAPPDPAPCVPTAIPLTAGGQNYSLLIGAPSEVTGGPTFTATIRAVPEPGTAALMAGVLGLGMWIRGRRTGRRREA